MRLPVELLHVRWDLSARAAAGSMILALTIGAACGPAGTTSPAPTASVAAATATARPTDSGPTAANPVALTMAVGANILYAPFYVGVEKSIFLSHGIDLKIRVVADGNEATRALQAGQAQFTGNSFPTVATAVVQGIPFKVFGLVVSRPDVAKFDRHLAIVVRPGITATKVSDLKGLKIGTSLGGGSETYIRATLRGGGLNADTDVKLINTTGPNLLAAMQTQSVDVISSAEPYPSLVLTRLPGSRVVLRGGETSDIRILIVALDSWLTGNPVLVDRLLAGLAEASQYARQHPAETGVAASHYLSGLEPEILAAAVKNLDFDPRWSPTVQEGFSADIQELVANGTIKTAPKVTDLLALDPLSGFEKKYPQFYNDLK